MKPLVRWSVGNPNIYVTKCLKCSIKMWRMIFGNSFDMVLLNNGEPDLVQDLPVDVIHRSDPCIIGNRWKLVPPRLNIHTKEIFIDSDLILYRYVQECEKDFFITEDRTMSYGEWGRLPFKLNSGFFGVPPGYDLETQINQMSKNYPSDQNDMKMGDAKFEQGLIARTLWQCNPTIISLKQIGIRSLGTNGIHFTGLSEGNCREWEQHKNRFISH